MRDSRRLGTAARDRAACLVGTDRIGPLPSPALTATDPADRIAEVFAELELLGHDLAVGKDERAS